MIINKPKLIAGIFTSTILVAVVFVFNSVEGDSHSVYKTALKFKKGMEKSSPGFIVFDDKADKNKVKKRTRSPGSFAVASVQEASKELNRKLDMPQRALAAQLEEIKEEHQDIIAEMKAQGVKVPALFDIEPELKIALGALLEIRPSSLSTEDLERANLSSEQWYFIKTFAASKDFKIILKEGSLDKESMNPVTLKKLYGSAHHLAKE